MSVRPRPAREFQIIAPSVCKLSLFGGQPGLLLFPKRRSIMRGTSLGPDQLRFGESAIARLEHLSQFLERGDIALFLS